MTKRIEQLTKENEDLSKDINDQCRINDSLSNKVESSSDLKNEIKWTRGKLQTY